MALYSVFMVAFLVTHQPLQFEDWSGLFHNQWMRFASLAVPAQSLSPCLGGCQRHFDGLCAPYCAQVDGRGAGHSRPGQLHCMVGANSLGTPIMSIAKRTFDALIIGGGRSGAGVPHCNYLTPI